MTDSVQESLETPSHPVALKEPDFMDPQVTMMILTWITFFSLLAILHKFAWKPILQGLEKREDDIRKAIEHADQLKDELAQIGEQRSAVLDEAAHKAKEIIDQSRKAAIEAANTIQQKAREESKILVENAQREIKESVEKARADLREETAHMAVSLASKLIQENLDKEKNQKLVSQLIKEI